MEQIKGYKDYQGLNKLEVLESRRKNGANVIKEQKSNAFLSFLKETVKEPLVLLLVLASSLYFFTGEFWDGIFLVLAIFFIIGISVYQEYRSENALAGLKQLTKPHTKVIREGEVKIIKNDEIVNGDLLILEEGDLISVDGVLLQESDFSVDESVLTGESLPVHKTVKDNNRVFAGSTVIQGSSLIKVTGIGENSSLGKMGKFINSLPPEKTLLETQIRSFVSKMMWMGSIVFFAVLGIHFFSTFKLVESLLSSLTLALSLLPEEIPVAYTSFMALGVWRLAKLGIITKKTKTVEALGSATVMCTDKTGTLTQNKMELVELYSHEEKKIKNLSEIELTLSELKVLETAMWASEPNPFDPMEKEIHKVCNKSLNSEILNGYEMIHEYSLGGLPPIMTHVWEREDNDQIIASKGAPEALINNSQLTKEEKQEAFSILNKMTLKGYRVLGVSRVLKNLKTFPNDQNELPFTFLGLVSFYDPPKENARKVLNEIKGSGVEVKMITGDNSDTASAIAKQIGLIDYKNTISGQEIMDLSSKDLLKTVQHKSIFTRMYPEAKLKVVNTLKENGEIVAMIGDGVNDGPALKASHIGISMGKEGTYIAKQTSDLVLIDDDLSKITLAVAMGRRIYSNLKKAILYIISIHIPIILVVAVPLIFKWEYPVLFAPIHVIVLELIMGPTCSIVFENEPLEKRIMTQKPKKKTKLFFTTKELVISILQGIIIAIGALFIYDISHRLDYGEQVTRTMVYVILIFSNMFLTLTNRSFYDSFLISLKVKNRMIIIVLSLSFVLFLAMIYIPRVTYFFEFQRLTGLQLIICISIAFTSVAWFELLKLFKRIKNNSESAIDTKDILSNHSKVE